MEEDEDDEVGARFATLESRFKNKETACHLAKYLTLFNHLTWIAGNLCDADPRDRQTSSFKQMHFYKQYFPLLVCRENIYNNFIECIASSDYFTKSIASFPCQFSLC